MHADTTDTIRLAIHGAAGRMGRRLVALACAHDRLTVTAASEAPGHPQLGEDAGRAAGLDPIDVPIRDAPALDDVDVLIDFSGPEGTRRALAACVQHGTAMVIGTTALTDDDQRAIDRAGHTIAVLQAANMSLGVNLLLNLCARVAHRLGEDYDVEIVETHHRFKADAPSGTAMAIARAICEATGRDVQRDLDHGRHGPNVPRQRGRIGMHALRSGDVVGRHTASFATLGEELQLTHIATNRDVFARGALHAACWLHGRAPRRYAMTDVLGL